MGSEMCIRDSIATFQPAAEFAFVVALDTVGDTRRDHAHDDAQGVGRIGAAIDDVADKDDLAARWRDNNNRSIAAILGPGDAVAELAEQGLKFVRAAVDVAYDVERTAIVALVCPQFCALNYGIVYLFFGVENKDMPKAFSLQSS